MGVVCVCSVVVESVAPDPWVNTVDRGRVSISEGAEGQSVFSFSGVVLVQKNEIIALVVDGFVVLGKLSRIDSVNLVT